MFENNGHIHAYSSGEGEDNPLFFKNTNLLSVWLLAASFTHKITVFATGIQILPSHKIGHGQGQPRVNIYINFVELESPMLHAKFYDHRASGSEEEDF